MFFSMDANQQELLREYKGMSIHVLARFDHCSVPNITVVVWISKTDIHSRPFRWQLNELYVRLVFVAELEKQS